MRFMKNTKKLFKMFLAAVVSVAAVFSLASCDWLFSWFRSENIKVYMPDGAPLLSFAKLRDDNPEIKKGYTVEYSTVLAADALQASLIAKEPDIAVAPINVCAAVNNGGSGYVLAGVSVWGIMHIVSNQSGEITLESLKGNTVLAFGRGGTPGITLRAILNQNGIKYVEDKGAGYSTASDEVNIVYLSDAADVRNVLVASGGVDGAAVKFALLAEPVATAITGATSGKDWGAYKAVINLQEEWAKKNGSIFPQAGVVVKESLIKKDKDFVDKFIAALKESADFAVNNPFEAGEIAKNRLNSAAIPNGTVVKTAVEAGRLPLNYTDATAARASIEAYFNIILAETPTLVGGKLPSDGFYFY
jgi:NitT/TauT family transport system substrate-binding protein